MSEAEVESRIIALESKVNGAVELPMGSVSVDDATITNKTGWCTYGEIAGINGGKLYVGVSLVAQPSTDAHIQKPFIFRAL